MEVYRYTYLLMGLLFFVIWLLLYFYRKDTRKEMLLVSVIVAILGPASNIVFIVDWWKPVSIWGPDVALIESLLAGFSIGGVACVIYEDIFRKRIKPRKRRNKKLDDKRLLFLLLSTAGLGYFLFYALSLNGFISTNLALLYGTTVILVHRKDLIVESIASGLMLLVIAIIVYNALELLTPGWVNAFWYWQNVPEITFLNVPIDDVVHYLLAGAWVGVLYEYWQEGRLVSIRIK